MSRLSPFLLFQNGDAERAMEFYVSLVRDSEVTELIRWPENSPTAGKVMRGTFTIAGQTVLCTDSVSRHDFTFTPSVSLFLSCESEEEISSVATTLADGGTVLMPLDNYGFSRKFAFISDRFGVSWQLNLD